MPEVFPPPKANPITGLGGLITEFFYSWVVAISESNNNLEDRVSTIEKGETVEDFIAPTLLNSWVNSGAFFEEAGFYKDPFGRVHLKGVVKDGLLGSTNPIFILPEGSRPEKLGIYPIVSNSTIGAIDIFDDGRVSLVVGSNAFASLSGISFRAA